MAVRSLKRVKQDLVEGVRQRLLFPCYGPYISQVVLVVKTPPASTGDARVVGLIPGLRQLLE